MKEQDFDKGSPEKAREPTTAPGPGGVQERVAATQAEDAFRAEKAGEAGYVPMDRLCKECKWAAKPAIIGQWNYANCTYPLNPINLVTGTRIFPCVISRGFDQLCGWKGVHWEKR